MLPGQSGQLSSELLQPLPFQAAALLLGQPPHAIQPPMQACRLLWVLGLVLDLLVEELRELGLVFAIARSKQAVVHIQLVLSLRSRLPHLCLDTLRNRATNREDTSEMIQPLPWLLLHRGVEAMIRWLLDFRFRELGLVLLIRWLLDFRFRELGLVPAAARPRPLSSARCDS